MEVSRIAEKYNIQDSLNQFELIPQEFKNEGLIGKIVFYWSKIKTSTIINEQNQEVSAIIINENKDNQSFIELKDVTVKMLIKLY